MLSLGEWAVTDDSDRELVCLGLGSCVAFCAHDPAAGIAGMAHMVLPDSANGKPGGAEAKFVDLAIPLVLKEMEALGASRGKMKVHLAGGAQMLHGASFTDTMQIGKRNADAAHETLKKLGLRIASDDTGGNSGRTVRLIVANGQLDVSTAQKRLAKAA
jgi:chemotaxis protein CheD